MVFPHPSETNVIIRPFIHTGYPCSPSISNGHGLKVQTCKTQKASAGLRVLIAYTNGTLARAGGVDDLGCLAMFIGTSEPKNVMSSWWLEGQPKG